MKSVKIICQLLIFGIFLQFPCIAQKKEKAEPGAKSPEALSEVLFQALKMDNFDYLDSYIPMQEQVDYLQKNATEKNKPFFESLDPAGIRSRLEDGFKTITRKGIEDEINWSEVELVDFKTRSCSIELIGCNVAFTIEDQNQNRLIVVYDAIKAGDRWFLFQGLGLEQ